MPPEVFYFFSFRTQLFGFGGIPFFFGLVGCFAFVRRRLGFGFAVVIQRTQGEVGADLNDLDLIGNVLPCSRWATNTNKRTAPLSRGQWLNEELVDKVFA